MKKKRILVVDDEKDFLNIIKLNLEMTGKYEVLTVSTGKDIVSHLNSFRPDIILLDLIMPGVGGMDVCEMLNNDSRGRKTPVIILSALEKDQDKLKAYKLGVVDYLTKPINMKELAARIDKALEFK